ncbi:hypothetical protein [Estrella lausannensis]|uniref:Putative membrane protein n=1 Tax=Estrella lausannensis TaxID=483423 RepID=A0A0H5DQ14_9BACT|nr:hypothetical protein [Estrella lausannensis]CRX37604.1 putative membrane protein [Estrella lausannensis]
MNILLVERFEADWFEKHPQYLPLQDLRNDLQENSGEMVSGGGSVMRGGRKYVGIDCLKRIGFLERALRLVVAIAATILTGFIALAFQNVRHLWRDCFRGEIAVTVLIDASNPSDALLARFPIEGAPSEDGSASPFIPRTLSEVMIPGVDVTRNAFADLSLEQRRQHIVNLYRSFDLKILSERGLERERLIDVRLNDPTSLGSSVTDAPLLQNMWLYVLKGNSDAARRCVQGAFAGLDTSLLFCFVRERLAIAKYYRDFYVQNSSSITDTLAAQWENLGCAIGEYIHKVADLTEVVDEYCRIHGVAFSR